MWFDVESCAFVLDLDLNCGFTVDDSLAGFLFFFGVL